MRSTLSEYCYVELNVSLQEERRPQRWVTSLLGTYREGETMEPGKFDLLALEGLQILILFSDYNSYRKKFDLFGLNELGIKSCLNECCRLKYNR